MVKCCQKQVKAGDLVEKTSVLERHHVCSFEITKASMILQIAHAKNGRQDTPQTSAQGTLCDVGDLLVSPSAEAKHGHLGARVEVEGRVCGELVHSVDELLAANLCPLLVPHIIHVPETEVQKS